MTQIHFQLCVDSSDNQDEEQSEQSEQPEMELQTESQETPQVHVELEPLTPPISNDKHSKLISVLKDGDVVSMTYKKQTFNAVFTVKTPSQHGYILKSGETEYNTPSHFSHAKKVSINDKIKSDNGWDTVYVKQNNKKVSLNDLLATSA